MTEYIGDLARTALFSRIGPEDIAGLLGCIGAQIAQYAKDEFIIEEGDRVCDLGILLSGHARSIKWDAEDRLIIITLPQKGDEIGVLLAAIPDRKSPVSVQAQNDASVLSIPFERILARCEAACPRHERLLRNYIGVVAKKGLVLHERIDCLLKPTVREKILAYLMRMSRESGSRVFSIPLNRNAMAGYLNVERSALSRELSNMKKDGLMDYRKNTFELL